MVTPINEILEELFQDMGWALTGGWEYVYQEKMLGPEHGLYVDISPEHMAVHGRVGTEELICSQSGWCYATPKPDYDIMLAGLIYFYRLIGQHLDIPQDELAEYSVKWTEKVLRAFTTMTKQQMITMSFKGNQTWIDINHRI